MKKLLIAVLVILLTLIMASCVEKEVGIDLYKDEVYAKEYTYGGGEQWSQNTSERAKKFFPSYEEIEYQYSEIEFYSYYDNLLGSSFVLELVFDNEEEYQKSKDDIYSNYEFLQDKVLEGKKSVMPAYELYTGEYFIKIVQYSDWVYPNNFAAICVNDEEYIIRYFFYYDLDLYDLKSESQLRYHIQKYSNCEW
ncbi:MAG: hypothetical protein IJX99_03035 [Clostridia bacterium]|nr:hypothetical protein [Clostridia bacterium]